MEKIIDIIDTIAYEKGLKVSDVEEALKEAMVITAQKMMGDDLNFSVDIDRSKKELKLFQKIEVLADNDKRLYNGYEDEEGNSYNTDNFIPLSDAKDVDSGLEIGDFLEYDLEFEHMGRNASMILHNNFEYKIQRFLENNIFDKYQKRIGNIVTAIVTRVDQKDNTYIEIGEVKGIMPRKNRIKGEMPKTGDTIKAIIRNVRIDRTHGLIIEISRTTPKFLEALIALEVIEVKDQKIKIEASARIPGNRAKIAVSSNDATVDPIGSIVGQKGIRINAISKELQNENIDCIEYSAIDEIFISRALSPAIINSVKILKHATPTEFGEAEVTVFKDQKSKLIGKAGVNVRLATMLTRYKINIIEVDGETKQESPSERTSNANEPKKDLSSLEALFN